MALHARIGPSSLKATKLCPGRVAANEKAERKPSIEAAEGTFLHDIAAACLDLDLDPFDFVGQTRTVDGFEFTATDELVECMVRALDWIRDQDAELFVECRVNLDPYMPGQFGTLDVAILVLLDDGRWRLIVFDWKFGMGICVPIVGNYQIRAYAIGFIETHLKPRGIEVDEVMMIIEQPRLAGAPRFWEPWTIDVAELMTFGAEMREIYDAANKPDAPRIAGKEQCRFCAVGKPGGCKAYDDFHYEIAQTYFDDDDVDEDRAPQEVPYAGLPPARASYLIRHRTMLDSYLKKLEADGMLQALHNNAPPGLKAIDGPQGDRQWVDEKKVEAMLVKALDEAAYTKKLIGPAGAEKVTKPGRKKAGHPDLWKDLQAQITRAPGKPMLVLASDPRPAKVLAESLLDEEDDDDLI